MVKTWAQSKPVFAAHATTFAFIAITCTMLTLGITGYLDFHDLRHLPAYSCRQATSSTTKVFQDQSLNKTLSESFWADVLPTNGGFVSVDSEYFIAKGRHIKLPAGADLVGISMFHQLHCLQMLRNELKSYTQDVSGTQLEHAAHLHLTPGDPTRTISSTTKKHNGHLFHCLDYLAQGVICNADSTLEPTTDETGAIDGAGVEHNCNDASSLYRAVQLDNH